MPSLDREIVYPGAIPLDTDILAIERNVMVAIGYLAQATLGQTLVADGLACAPTLPASMVISIGPGSLSQLGVVDTEPFGSLPAEPVVPLVQTGINLLATQFTLTAPTVAGQAVNYLIEASFLQADATPVVLPYYNAANPGLPYSGPGNSGAPQNTQRLQSVQLQMKAGAPAALGSQATPSVDAGWAGLYVVTVSAGATAITASNISVMPGAPFIAWKLPKLTPGTSRMAVFTPASQGIWNVPQAVTNVKVRVWGGGGAGGEGFGAAGGGGAGGGYTEGYCTVSPGEAIAITVGNGGVGAGTNGAASSFGTSLAAGGGAAGGNGASGAGGAGGGVGGIGSGGALSVSGQAGASAFAAGSIWVSGRGGGAYAGTGAEAAVGTAAGNSNGASASLPGAGGAGGVGGGLGGQGGTGLVLLEW